MEEKNKDIVADGQQESLLFQDACQIIEQAQAVAYRQINETLIKRNWLLGMRIQHDYSTYNGLFLNVNGESANVQTILHAVSAKSENIFHALRAKSPIRLSWTHYRIILQENNQEARDWYEQEAAREMWGTRTLQRNVSSQYYHRLLQSQNKDAVRGEMKQLTAPLQDKLEYIKNPVVAEFLGFKNRSASRD